MSKVQRYDLETSVGDAGTFGMMDPVENGDWVRYDDYAEAVSALRECEKRLALTGGYDRAPDVLLQALSDNGDNNATAIVAARAVLERAP